MDFKAYPPLPPSLNESLLKLKNRSRQPTDIFPKRKTTPGGPPENVRFINTFIDTYSKELSLVDFSQWNPPKLKAAVVRSPTLKNSRKPKSNYSHS